MPRRRPSIARSTSLAFAQVATAGACAPYEKEFIRRNGERVSVVVGYARVFASADEYVGFALDVTERKLLEQQLRQQADQLLLADRRKDEFLAMLAHELRNPLAPLRNALYLLEADKQGQSSTVDSVLPTMRRQIDQLVRMVDDLLDAARISQNKILVEKDRRRPQADPARRNRDGAAADQRARPPPRSPDRSAADVCRRRQRPPDPDIREHIA